MFRRGPGERGSARAIDRDPPLKKGEYCRWCPAKIACPLWTAPIMGLAEAIGDKVGAPDDGADAGHVRRLRHYLAKAKAFVDLLAMYTKEVNDQLHTYLEDGGEVPGWRLKDKAKQRQWVDEDIVQANLSDLGFS